MQKYVVIEVDCNDADNCSRKTALTDEQILKLKGIINKMPKKSRGDYEVIQYKTGEFGGDNLVNEYSDYHYLTDEEKYFLNEFLPRTEYGFHTILDVVILQELESFL